MNQLKNWDDLKIAHSKYVRGSSKHVTFYLTKQNTINLYMTSGFLRQVSEDYLIIGWSPLNNAIVLFFIEEKETGVKKISRKNTSASISIQCFLNFCNINKNELIGSYIPKYEKIFEDKCGWVIYLDKKINTSIV